MPSDLLQDFPDMISSSSVLHDDVTAHTARVKSIARRTVLQYNDNAAVRRAVDQRPRPFRDFAVGTEVAVWRGTGRGAPGKQRRAQWRGPGIVLGATRGNYLVEMPGSVVKAFPERVRHRTDEEKEADRVVVWTFLEQLKFCGNGSAKNVEDISQEWPDGEVEPGRDLDEDEVTTEKPSVTVTEGPVVRRRLTSKTELLVIGSESRSFHDDEEEEADNMFLVASSMEPNVRSEGCLLVGGTC